MSTRTWNLCQCVEVLPDALWIQILDFVHCIFSFKGFFSDLKFGCRGHNNSLAGMRSYEWRQVYEAVIFPAPLQPLIIYKFFAISAAKVRLSEQKTKFWSSKCREMLALSLLSRDKIRQLVKFVFDIIIHPNLHQ
jgi:hypothetical protein